MATPETLWRELTVTALLGTQRRPFRPPLPEGRLGVLFEANPTAPATRTEEQRLLQAAALTGVYRKAGRLPPKGTPHLPAPCPEEDWPRCSPEAGACLEQIFRVGPISLLPEWVGIAAAHRQRIREEHLVALFEQSKALQPLRRSLAAVLGERGRWLANQNPAWRAAYPNLDERTWEEGRRKERLAFFADLRAEKPQRALELLCATWAHESPADRTALLPLLAEGLSLADEPFLESVLDNQRKDVRQAAAALLARLPDSRLVQRMTRRAQESLTWKAGLLRGSLAINLPPACDAAMQRDGIEPQPASEVKLGEKAYWLVQVIGRVPPRAWTQAWKKNPAQILDAARKHEWEEPLVTGWSEAAIRFQDQAWMEALVIYRSLGPEPRKLFEIFPHLPPASKETLVLSALRDNPSLSYEMVASGCLLACTHPWSVELTHAVTTNICWTLNKSEMPPWRWEKLLRETAPYFHPALLEVSIARINAALEKKETGDPYVQKLLVTLQSRLAMHRAFTK